MDLIFENNFFSLFKISQLFSSQFKFKKQAGSIVNISSIVGNIGFKELSGYASTKAAVDGLTKSLAAEFAENKIRVNSIAPGFIKFLKKQLCFLYYFVHIYTLNYQYTENIDLSGRS